MDDEAEKLILGDTFIAAASNPRGKGFFSRRRKAQPPPLPYCENCHAPMTGGYCAQCGQHAIDYRRSFGRVFVDVLDSFLNWDSKFFATLALLVTRPWRLTNDFLRGKRVRYVHPLRLYLLISVGFFFGIHELAKHAKFDPAGSSNRELTAEQKAKIEEKLKNLPAEVQGDVKKDLEAASKKKNTLHVGDDRDPKDRSPFMNWLDARAKSRIGENGSNLKLFLLTVVSNLPAMMLCCIPLFAFVLKILYLRRRVFYVDHLIYSLHIHAFAYIAILVIGFAAAGSSKILPNTYGWINAAFIISAVWVLLMSVRRVYRQSWVMSFLKFAFGGLIYVFVLAMALAATFFVTLALPD